MKKCALPLLALVMALAGVACGEASSSHRIEPKFATDAVALPAGPDGSTHVAAAKDEEPQEIDDVDTGKLDRREKKLWWDLVSELYAPCSSEAVSVAECVKQKRGCDACQPAASLLAAKVKEGATREQGEALYAIRFGPNVKKIDLRDSPAIGPADAPVTIVVWSDFECPACGYAVPMIEKLVEKHGNEVRLVHKLYPLKMHTHADGAARAAVAAMNQGKYWEMHRVLFDHQHKLEESDLVGYAKELGLDVQRFQADMRSQKTTDLIARDRVDADAAGLTGTPFILINGRELDYTYFHVDEDLEPWIELELRLKRKR